MKRLKFVFLAVFILCLASCEKEEVKGIENLQYSSLLTKKIENENLIERSPIIIPRSFKYENALNALLELDAKDPFIESMLEQLGGPYWEGMYSVTDPEETFEVFFVPLIKSNSSRIGGFIQFADHSHEDFYHLNVIPVSYVNQLDATLDENFVAHVVTNVAFDGVLFGMPVNEQLTWLLNNYLVNLKQESIIETRTIEITYDLHVPAGCLNISTGCNDITANWHFPQGTVQQVSYIPTTIILSCVDSEDSIFFDPDGEGNGNNNTDGNNSGGGGGNSILNPPFLGIITLLQNNCEDDSDDDDGAGTDTNSETETTHLSTTEQMILDAWCNYKKKCLSDDFSGVQPLNMPIGYNQSFATNPYYQWSQLMYNIGTEEFLNAMSYGYGCVSTDDIDLIECISDKFDDFVETYALNLTESGKDKIKKTLMEIGECGNNFENDVFAVIEDVENNVCKSSFDNYTQTGAGATIQVECVKALTMIFNPLPIKRICYDFQDICITTGTFELIDGEIEIDENGNPIPMGMNTRKELTAAAYNAARVAVHEESVFRYEFGLDEMTQQEAEALFINTLETELEKRMTGIAVSTGDCEGDIGVGAPAYDFFGVCLEGKCKC